MTTAIPSDPSSFGEALARLSASPGRVWIVVPDDQDRFEDFAASQPYGSRLNSQTAWTNVELYMLNP